MSVSPTIHDAECESSDRRLSSRKAVKWVVLLYFGQDNWGKLIDLSESGMRFEFAQPPSERERINFTLEAMGRLPDSFGGEIISDSFQAAGEVRWMRDFERTAGVQFAILPEASREQIRKWLSFEASPVTASSNTKTEPQAPVAPREPPEPLSVPLKTLPTIDENESQLDIERVESDPLPLMDANSPLVKKILEAPTLQAYCSVMAEEEKKQAEPSGANPRMSRTHVMSITVGLAAVFAIGGIRMILPRLTYKVPMAEGIAGPNVALGTEYGSASGSQRPFLVEVSDANNRTWLLSFDGNRYENAATQAAYRSTPPSSMALSKGASPTQPAVSAKPAVREMFTMIGPKVNQPRPNSAAMNSPSAVAPLVGDDLQAPLEAPIAGALTSHAAPKPVGESTSLDGRVQLARLLKSVPPVYPPFAQSSRVSGDVTLDAFIDANGNVTAMKVISGPTILRQAAVDAVHQWKYDPARLNGQPVPVHLTVTVKFRRE